MDSKSFRQLALEKVLQIKTATYRALDLIKNNRNAAIIAGIVIVNAFLVIIIFLLPSLNKLRTSLKTNPIPTPFVVSVTPTPTPVPLVQGPQTFSIGMKGIPEMYEVWFNTIDPKKGVQTVKLKIRDKTGKITSVKATVKTEKSKKTYDLSFSEGSASDGTWTGSWRLNDTYNRNFMITFSAADDKGNKSSVDLTIR